MESPEFSGLSSLRGDFKPEDYINPHYKESYRLAIDRLVSGGRDSYQEFLKGERIGSFLSEDEILFITENSEQPPLQNHEDEINGSPDTQSSSGTYWPVHSDVETPDLDLGWPEVMHENLQTNIDLLFHPPRQNNPTIKEVIRKQIQEAKQVIGIVMDMFTDVDIFKEAVDASVRGVPVYILLDHFHLKNFLTMAENQDVKIQQLRNMRVRTVKGQDYLCQSGAKFHGAMEQKFLIVDCHTAIYGSYSFSWSFEKVNLSMVQVITGHLVKSYDEEFRTLYARSQVPAELCPAEGLFQRNGSLGRQVLPKSHSAQKIERRDQLRHTLDTVYRKTCEKNLGTRDFEDRLFEEDTNKLRPLIENGVSGPNQMPPFQSTEAMNILKRHSYAGEREGGYVPQNIRARASNWNISRDPGNGFKNYPVDNYSQVPHLYRNQNMRQSYNDNLVIPIQQNMPSIENTSKSFMRNLRIDSYLKNPDVPYRDSCEYLDHEPTDKASSFMQGRMRTSLAFRSTIPEQMEANRHINNSTYVNPAATQNTPLHYSSMQWNPTPPAENRMSHDEFMLKRQSLQLLDDNRHTPSYGRQNSYSSMYSSLNRPKGGHMMKNPDIMTDSWNKRHSVADPRSNSEYSKEPTSHVYGAYARMQANRSTTGINAQNGGYVSNLNEDQRSVSHYDVKSITSTKSPSTPSWQEPPLRTVSAAALDLNSKEESGKSHHNGSHHFLKKSTKKIKSLLNIPEKKEGSLSKLETQSWKSGTSTDTITAEDEEETSQREGKHRQSTTNSGKSPSGQRRTLLEDNTLKPSKPRFGTEEQRNPPQTFLPRTASSPVHDNSTDKGGWSRERSTETRLYSRFEPFCSLDKNQPQRSAHSFKSTLTQDKHKGLPKVEFSTDHSLSQASRGHHENKLEKFIHRVGNLIHKNK
ncbi:protein FAM83B [Cheilinus undulatus]|uniref:protein FAM83B n=1 Tax=Cheilinus undulatus TaxID=241271 RepID=UPI001BD48173|nr:protein FAM83B [Cheilinus undulatus]